MNKPVRYISRESMQDAIVDFAEVRKFYDGKEWMQERIDDLLFDFSMIQKLKPFAAVNYIRKGIGYEDYLRTYAKEHRLDADELEETLEKIHASAKNFDTFEQWFAFIDTYNEAVREQNQSKGKKTQEDAVNICTMHSCKGLEFDKVFMLDAVEGMMPYHKALLDSEIEEERRMFYVAMTRAKKMLTVCFVDERYNKKMQMSRFIEEMDAKMVQMHLLAKNEEQ